MLWMDAEKKGESKKERSIYVKEKHWSVASHMHPPRPRCVSWPGIEPATSGALDNSPTNWATRPGPETLFYLSIYILYHLAFFPLYEN